MTFKKESGRLEGRKEGERERDTHLCRVFRLWIVRQFRSSHLGTKNAQKSGDYWILYIQSQTRQQKKNFMFLEMMVPYNSPNLCISFNITAEGLHLMR